MRAVVEISQESMNDSRSERELHAFLLFINDLFWPIMADYVQSVYKIAFSIV